jgi:8-oxo-dGTP pyrophosphatase MutT (NUDIX family)
MPPAHFVKDNIVIDASLQQEIIKRAVDGNFGDNPDQAVHTLGTIKLPDGNEVPLHLRHAAEAILLDDFGNIVLITRRNNPGAGLKALPGGFIDSVPGIDGTMVAENAATAALREAAEETGIDEHLLKAARIIPIGSRCYSRPFDIRVVWGDIPGTDIRKGDVFAVSTQAFCAKATQDLSQVSLKAGDDADGVHVAKVCSLTPDQFGIPDHLPMIRAAQATS